MTRTKRPEKKLSTELICNVYDSFLRESELGKVASALDTTTPVLLRWLERMPELTEARQIAESRRQSENTFPKYIFKHLSPEAKELWKQIEFFQKDETAYEKVSKILDGCAKRLRQELFIHALINNSWNPSEACRIIAISYQTLNEWRKSDMGFRQMVEEIEHHKKNFFEGALMDLVSIRNPGAVMFVNRTKNADRGYSEKIDVNHMGSVNMGMSIEDLDLSIDTRREILEAIRKKNSEKELIEDAEVIKEIPAKI